MAQWVCKVRLSSHAQTHTHKHLQFSIRHCQPPHVSLESCDSQPVCPHESLVWWQFVLSDAIFRPTVHMNCLVFYTTFFSGPKALLWTGQAMFQTSFQKGNRLVRCAQPVIIWKVTAQRKLGFLKSPYSVWATVREPKWTCTRRWWLEVGNTIFLQNERKLRFFLSFFTLRNWLSKILNNPAAINRQCYLAIMW